MDEDAERAAESKKGLRVRFQMPEEFPVIELPEELNSSHVFKQYHLEPGTCNRHPAGSGTKIHNCKDNPYCISRLGNEKFDKLIKRNIGEQKRAEKVVDVRNPITRPCGLNNPGNFCYVNSFLQIWFNEPIFRQIVYDFKPIAGWVNTDKLDLEVTMTCLQELFYGLQTSPFDACDPTDFARSLGLNAEQQDAQEFSIMLFGALERILLKHPIGIGLQKRIDTMMKFNVVQRLVCKCGRESSTSMLETSLHLPFNDEKRLTDLLRKQFSPEKLEHYKCAQCNEEGTTIRFQHVEMFPQVLTLHISRYRMDGTSSYPKKNKSALQFPRKITGLHINCDDESAAEYEYDLFAVMIHEGDQMYCGHYTDIILRPEDGKWYSYNDQNVTEVRPPGTPNDIAPPSSKIGPEHKHCYALLYRRVHMDPKTIRLPDASITNVWKSRIEEAFRAANGKPVEAAAAGMDEVKKRAEYCEKMLWKLEGEPHSENEISLHPQSKAFIPTSLLSKILDLEYSRVEELKTKLENAIYEGEDPEAIKSLESEKVPSSSVESSPQKNGCTIMLRHRKRCASTNPERQKRNYVEQQILGPMIGCHCMRVCPHGRVEISQVHDGSVKLVEYDEAEKMLKRYGLTTSLVRWTENGQEPPVYHKMFSAQQLCCVCVEELKIAKEFQQSVVEDSNIAKKCCTGKPKEDAVYIVAKEALRNFKQKIAKVDAMRRTKEQCQSSVLAFHRTSTTPNIVSADSAEIEQACRETMMELLMKTESAIGVLDSRSVISMSGSLISEFDDLTLEFNSELKCMHGNFNASQSNVRITREDWKRFSTHFGRSFPVLIGTLPCVECAELEEQKAFDESENAQKISQLLINLRDFIRTADKRYTSPKTSKPKSPYTHVLCSKFIEKLKDYRAYRSRRMNVRLELCQECFLCEQHSIPFISFDPSEFKDSAYPIPVTQEEWDAVTSVFGTPDGSPEAFQLQESGAMLKFCDECYQAKTQQILAQRYVYENKVVYVKQLADQDEAGSSIAEPKTRRNVHRIKISSSKTIKDLKVELYRLTKYSPIDQLLYLYEGGPVLENELTLEAARVAPENADKPLIVVCFSSSSSVSPSDTPRPIERGFTDTALAH